MMRYLILILLVCGGQGYAENLPCSLQELTLMAGQVSGSGSDPVEAIAIQRAQEAIARQMEAARVSTQFIQEVNYDQGQRSVIKHHSSLQQQVKIDPARATYHKAYCQNQWHILMVYDLGSLAAQVGKQLSAGNYKPRGAAYLINSRLLRPYQVNEGPTVVVRLSAGPQQLFLHVGESKYEVKLNELEDIVQWPAASKHFFSLPHHHIVSGESQMLATHSTSSMPIQVFICGEGFACTWLQRVTTDHYRGEVTALKNSAQGLHYLVAIPEDLLLQNSHLLASIYSPDFFLFALEQLDRAESTSHWQTLFAPGIF